MLRRSAVFPESNLKHLLVCKPERTGLHIVSICETKDDGGCGQALEMLIEYAELVAIASGMSPNDVFHEGSTFVRQYWTWESNDKATGWSPSFRCGACGHEIRIWITGIEAKRSLKDAKKRCWISASEYAAIRAVAGDVAVAQSLRAHVHE